jgi:hypothetical protein
VSERSSDELLRIEAISNRPRRDIASEDGANRFFRLIHRFDSSLPLDGAVYPECAKQRQLIRTKTNERDSISTIFPAPLLPRLQEKFYFPANRALHTVSIGVKLLSLSQLPTMILPSHSTHACDSKSGTDDTPICRRLEWPFRARSM